MVLDLAASELRSSDPGVTLASSNVGSLGGLIALRDGLCHLAGSHLLEPRDRRVHDSLRRPICQGRRDRGRPAGPPRTGTDRSRRQPPRPEEDRRPRPARTALRQPPAGRGTRVLLDYELSRDQIDPATITGYAREEPTISRSPPRSPPVGPTADWASGRLPGPSVSTSSRSPRSPTTSCSTRDAREELLEPFWRLLDSPDFRASSSRWAAMTPRDGPPHPLTPPVTGQPPPIPVLRITCSASTGKASSSTGWK